VGYLTGFSQTEQAATVMANGLRKIGIESKLMGELWPTMVDRMKKPETSPDLVVYWISTYYADPNNWIGEMFHSGQWGTFKASSFYKNVKVGRAAGQRAEDHGSEGPREGLPGRRAHRPGRGGGGVDLQHQVLRAVGEDAGGHSLQPDRQWPGAALGALRQVITWETSAPGLHGPDQILFPYVAPGNPRIRGIARDRIKSSRCPRQTRIGKAFVRLDVMDQTSECEPDPFFGKNLKLKLSKAASSSPGPSRIRVCSRPTPSKRI
jgi:hypothetical protein